MYYSINDATYWYEIHGEGTPVVFLHGFTGSTETWKPFVDLAMDFKFIMVDLPGHGRTITNSPKTMEDCCHDLHHLFRAIGLDSFYLLGYSMGGRTALSYTCLYSKEIRGLILESASPGLETAEERTERREKDEKLAKRIEENGLESFVDFWENIPLFQTQKNLPDTVKQKIKKERLSQSTGGLSKSLRYMGTGKQPSWWSELSTLDLPILLLAGEMDHKYVQISKKMQKLMISCKLKICEKSGHSIHVEDPKNFIRLVSRFIKEVHSRNLKEDSYDS